MSLRPLLIALTAALAFTFPLLAEPPATPVGNPEPSPYIRSHDSDNGATVSMQAAVRTFEPIGGKGPTITLAAAVHIGDKPFYLALQDILNTKEAVLFEGVMPPGTGRTEFDLDAPTDEARAKRTERRIRLVAIAARMQKNATGEWPASLEDIAAKSDDRLKGYIAGASVDAWGHPLSYAIIEVPSPPPPAPAADEKTAADAKPTTPETTIEITSLGADGQRGGEGVNRDLLLSDQPKLKAREVPKPDSQGKKGLQQQLADAMGLVFQLDIMKHSGENWRNADLSIDQVQERMAKAGADSEALFKMLDGSSIQATIARLILGLVKMMPAAQIMGKLAMVEVLSRADDAMELAGSAGLDKAAMDVILKDRNQVVLADLNRLLKEEPAIKSIGIIYGAAHMPGIESAILVLGYKEASVQWLDAISIDTTKAGMSQKEVQQFRKSITSTLDAQLKALKKRAKP